MAATYQRILLKLSGEVLAGTNESGLDGSMLDYVAKEVRSAVECGVQVAIVIGGGNIFRGVQGQQRGIPRASGDLMGMLATVINSVALQETLESLGLPTLLQTAIPMGQIGHPFHRKQAIQALTQGTIVVFAAGTGHPFFTTDTAAALRAVEIGADAIFKATKVDGVYSADPVKDPTAVRFGRISYIDVLQRQLRVMDLTAISFCLEHDMPIVVFDLKEPGNIKRILSGEAVGTVVHK